MERPGLPGAFPLRKLQPEGPAGYGGGEQRNGEEIEARVVNRAQPQETAAPVE